METQSVQPWLTSVMVAIFLLTFIGQQHMTTASEGSFFKILTTGRAHTMNIHESLVLECEFSTEYFYLFDNPVLWKKTQQNEETSINLMSNINRPFAATGRFEVSFTEEPPRYQLELAIVDLSIEDSGNYTCEVRGPQSTILGNVTHQIYVRAPVETLYITKNNSSMMRTDTTAPTDVDTGQIMATKRGLNFIEGYPQTLSCTSEGGFPAPEMLIYIGNHDVTSNFTLTHREKWRGLKGLRVVSYTTERVTTQLMARPQFDGKKMQCIVTVPGIGANITTVKIKVRYTPVIRCYSTKAYLRDNSATLRCEVKAKPGLTTLYWIIDDNGTKLSEGAVKKEYWTIKQDKRNGVLETRLFIRRVKESSFRTYTVVAGNGIGEATNDVELVRGYRVPHKMYGEAGKIPRDRRPSRGYSKWSSVGVTRRLDSLTCLVTFCSLLMYVHWR